MTELRLMPCCRWDLPMSPVRYPAARKRRTWVFAPQSSDRSFMMTPWLVGMRPVMIVDRLGMQIGLATHALSNTIPRAAKPSRLGVRTTSLPA